MFEDCSNEFFYDDYPNLIELNKESLKDSENIYKAEDDEDDEKDQKFIIYDIIQDNYNKMKNYLLMLQKRLIKNPDISSDFNQNEDLHSNSENISKNNSDNNKKNLVKTRIKKQRKIHSKFSDDLIFIRVKVLYHKFLISLSNDCYCCCQSSLTNDTFIKNLSGKISHSSGKEYNKKLGELSLKDFLSNPISSHYSNFEESSNKKNITIAYKNKNGNYKNLINLLNCNYKYFFKNFYIKSNCIELIEQHFNTKRKSFISFKESVKKLVEKESKDYINKMVEFAEEKFIGYLEGKRSKKKIIDYNIKLNDLFNISPK